MITLYRYVRDAWSLMDDEGGLDENLTPLIKLQKFKVVRETEKSYFIYVKPLKEKRVSKTAKNTYAYAHMEKARENFFRRCLSNKTYCDRNQKLAEIFLHEARKMKSEDRY